MNFIIVFQLLRALVCLWEAVMVLGLQKPEYDYLLEGQGLIILQSGFALAGLPIMIMALWGVSIHDEVTLRVYAYYMLLGCLIDEGLTARSLFMESPCDFHPGAANSGQAFSCGAIRVLDLAAIALLSGLELYFAFVVFSLCESFRLSGSGPAMSDLRKSAFESNEAKVLEGYFGVSQLAKLHMDGYGSLAPSSGARIFGTRHDMQFPPQRFHD